MGVGRQEFCNVWTDSLAWELSTMRSFQQKSCSGSRWGRLVPVGTIQPEIILFSLIIIKEPAILLLPFSLWELVSLYIVSPFLCWCQSSVNADTSSQRSVPSDWHFKYETKIRLETLKPHDGVWIFIHPVVPLWILLITGFLDSSFSVISLINTFAKGLQMTLLFCQSQRLFPEEKYFGRMCNFTSTS